MSKKEDRKINIKSPNNRQFGFLNISQISYDGDKMDPRDIQDYLKKLSSKDIENRLMRIKDWYESRQISLDTKEVLEIIVKHVDMELQASHEVIKNLKAEGNTKLASILEELNTAFEKSDIDELIGIRDANIQILRENEIDIYLDVAEKMKLVYRLKDSEENYSKAIQLFEKSNDIGSTKYEKALIDLSDVYLSSRKLSEALNTNIKLADAFPNKYAEISKEALDLDVSSSMISTELHLFKQAWDFFNRALYLHQKLKGEEDSTYAVLMNNLGIFYDYQKIYPQAELHALKAMAVAEKLEGKTSEVYASALLNFAKILSNQGNYPLAIDKYKDAKSIFEETGERRWLAMTYYNLGEAYSKNGKQDEGKEYFEKGLKLSKEIYGEGSPLVIFLEKTYKKIVN